MNWRAILAIVRKDLKVVAQNKGVVIPTIAVPVLLFGVLPSVATVAVSLAGSSLGEVAELLERMPASLKNELAVYTAEQQVVVFFLVYMLAPMFLIIPLMVASVIAADSFAGERERRTLDGKLLSAWLAAIAVALVGFLLYSVTANAAAWPIVGTVFFPNGMWIALVLWVVPATAVLGLGTMVLVSGRAQGFQDAYQIGGVVVVPILLLVFGQISGVMYFSVWLVILLGAVLWVADAVLVWIGSRLFRRGRLIADL